MRQNVPLASLEFMGDAVLTTTETFLRPAWTHNPPRGWPFSVISSILKGRARTGPPASADVAVAGVAKGGILVAHWRQPWVSMFKNDSEPVRAAFPEKYPNSAFGAD